MDSGCGSLQDPVAGVDVAGDPGDPCGVTVTIRLAEHVAACCINPDAMRVVFEGDRDRAEVTFTLVEARPAYRLEARLRLPSQARYRYRILARILQRTLLREGIYDACAS